MDLSPLVNQNLRFQQLQKQYSLENGFETIYPTITISRDPGSGGRAIAQTVAKKLGISCYDKKELTKLVALKAGIARSDIKQLMNEKIQDPIESMIDTILGLKRISDSTFMRNLVATVFDIISKQPVVILGSGINFILPYQTNFRVRVTAPRKILIAYAMKYEGHSSKKAIQIIDKYMKIRKDFVSKFFSKNISKSHYYDLVINTNFLTVDDAADVIVTAFRKKLKHLH